MEFKLVRCQTEWPPNGHTPDLTITLTLIMQKIFIVFRMQEYTDPIGHPSTSIINQ